MNKCYAIVLLLLAPLGLQADTFDNVISIFETKCQSCHGGNSPSGSLDLTGSKSEIWNRLYEQAPANAAANERGYKLVDAGYPERSSIYRKINNGLYHNIELVPGEGSDMSDNYAQIDDWEREVIRQWIYHGAKENGTIPVSRQETIQEYYEVGGLDRIERPDAPAEGEGFQLYCGNIFLEPEQEWEMVYKYELDNPEALEINRIEVVMPEFSHHFLFFKHLPGTDADDPEGFRTINIAGFITGEVAITDDTKMISGWEGSRDINLPVGTAYTWDAETVLKFNFHLKNYSTTQIFPGEIYINVYTQPVGTKLEEMHSDFLIDTNFGQSFPPTGDTIVVNDLQRRNAFSVGTNSDTLSIWLLMAHTHQLGVDYDLFAAEPNGSKGEKVYDAMYNYEYDFFAGYYDYSEPFIRITDDLEQLRIRRADGFVQEGKFVNNTGQSVGYGLTTDDEMLGFFVQYVVGDISELLAYQDSVANVAPTALVELDSAPSLSLFPNPNAGQFEIEVERLTGSGLIQIFDLSGREVFEQAIEAGPSSRYDVDLSRQVPGIYFVQLTAGDSTDVRRVMVR